MSSSGVMAEATPQPPHERTGRRRPFQNFMKKLANFKPASSSDSNRHTNPKPVKNKTGSKSKKNNNPYPQSGRIGIIEPTEVDRPSVSTARSGRTSITESDEGSRGSSVVDDGRSPPPSRSMAPTISTEHETSRSVTAVSHGASSVAGTSRTVNGGIESRRGGDSTFSSPAPSVRSLATTLTTIQSMAPAANGHSSTGTPQPNTNNSHNPNLSSSQVIHFNQPFPTTSPASAIPSHLTPTTTNTTANSNHPTTYSSATANNLLTDNASILTLASSSKRRRRRSLDTDASVRALAPSSLFGASRESLPLSVLSATVNDVGGSTTPGLYGARGAVNDRTSIYSTTGVMASDRSSYYAKQAIGPGDAASVRSGLYGHGRAESISGSIGGMPTNPLTSPREMEGEDEERLTHVDRHEQGDADGKES